MQKLRYNLFNHIHKALRARLFDASIQIQQTDFILTEATAGIISEIREILKVFEKYALIKDTIVFPLVEPTAPFVISLFEQEHLRHHELGRKLENFLRRYEESVTETEKQKSGINILFAFNDFISYILQQMNKEETIVNELLWASMSDDEMEEVAGNIARQLSPQEIASNARWMIRGLNDRELMEWLQTVKVNAPAAILESLLNIAEEELPSRRWHLIRREWDGHLKVVAA